MKRRLIGFIVNPIAGMGGKVALKGTDGVVEEAVKRGAKPVAPDVARLFLREIDDEIRDKIEFITGPAELGEKYLKGSGFAYSVIRHRRIGYRRIGDVTLPDTTSSDTKELAKRMAETVELIVFAGGDGTARDVFEAIGRKVPILGVPTGVKMFSGVFAAFPEAAAGVLTMYVLGKAIIEERDVMDLDEEEFRRDRVSPKHYGKALTPYVETLVQGAKQPSRADEGEDLEALADAVSEEILDDNGIYFLGAGSTIKRIKDRLRIDGTLLGVDVVRVRNGKAELLVKDASEKDLLKFVRGDEKPKIVVTVIGGLNFLFGRGNQQFSADVLREIPKENIIVVASRSKLNGPIRVYTGDKEVDEKLRGYIRVRFSPWMEKLVKVM